MFEGLPSISCPIDRGYGVCFLLFFCFPELATGGNHSKAVNKIVGVAGFAPRIFAGILPAPTLRGYAKVQLLFACPFGLPKSRGSVSYYFQL